MMPEPIPNFVGQASATGFLIAAAIVVALLALAVEQWSWPKRR